MSIMYFILNICRDVYNVFATATVHDSSRLGNNKVNSSRNKRCDERKKETLKVKREQLKILKLCFIERNV